MQKTDPVLARMIDEDLRRRFEVQEAIVTALEAHERIWLDIYPSTPDYYFWDGAGKYRTLKGSPVTVVDTNIPVAKGESTKLENLRIVFGRFHVHIVTNGFEDLGYKNSETIPQTIERVLAHAKAADLSNPDENTPSPTIPARQWRILNPRRWMRG